MPYYKRIRDLREDRDLTQTDMGKVLSCSQRVYSNYERGDIDIPTTTLIKIADFHNVSVDFLLDVPIIRSLISKNYSAAPYISLKKGAAKWNFLNTAE